MNGINLRRSLAIVLSNFERHQLPMAIPHFRMMMMFSVLLREFLRKFVSC